MDPQPVLNPMSTQVGIALIVPFVLQWLKNTPLMPWINHRTDWVVRLLSMAVAVASSVGIIVSWDPEAGALLITGLHLDKIAALIFQAFAHFKGQEIVYRTAIKPYQEPR
jgi:predicted Co/Zn/Cd cation transporter (cation efflux family)